MQKFVCVVVWCSERRLLLLWVARAYIYVYIYRVSSTHVLWRRLSPAASRSVAVSKHPKKEEARGAQPGGTVGVAAEVWGSAQTLKTLA